MYTNKVLMNEERVLTLTRCEVFAGAMKPGAVKFKPNDGVNDDDKNNEK